MSKNNRILILLLAVLTALFFIVRHSTDHTEKRARLFDFNHNDLTAVEMITARDTLRISRQDFTWVIEYPFYFDVNQSRLDSFFDQVLPVEKSSIPVAFSEDSFPKYQVTEENGTVLNLYDTNDRLIDSVIIGRSGRFAYARRPEINEVYQLTENISFTVNPGLNQWRSNIIVSIPRSQIKSLEVKYELNNYTLTATDTLWLFTDNENSFSVAENTNAMSRLLSKIERMNSFAFKDFASEEYENLLQDPQLILNIRTFDDSVLSLAFAYLEDEENFIVRRDEMIDHLFVIDPETVDLFTKDPQHFR
jgi:hypothetical protein